MKPGILTPRLVLLLLVSLVIVPLLPILISQRWDWWEGWVYAAANTFSFVISRILAGRRHPEIIEERARFMQQSNTASFDKRLVLLSGLSGVLIPLTSGLDELLNWSPAFSLHLKILALIIILAGFSLSSYALIENRYFSGTVRIQAERGHQVVSSGPYRWMRHPGYAGSMIANLAIPIFLDSSWTFLPAILAILILIIRTSLEDRYLQVNLQGYRDYTDRVPYRLIPGVW